MTISASEVKRLRDSTGAGMMDCKKALVETSGDFDKAVDILRKQGIAKAAKRADRSANEGLIYSYVHNPEGKQPEGHHFGRIGVLLEINCETDFVAKTEKFQNFCKDIAVHIIGMAPIAVSADNIPTATVEHEKEIYRAQMENEGKPSHIIDKIIDGKLEKYFQESCLLQQAFIKDPDQTVHDLLDGIKAETGEKVVIRRFTRFQLGEGAESTSSEE